MTADRSGSGALAPGHPAAAPDRAATAPAPPVTGTPPPAAGTPGRTFFGQPRWFGTLFMVDMWERFSFYGMRAILFLYLVAPTERGGLGVPAGQAAAVFGLYMSTVFLAALPGGWVCDRLLGARRAILLGALLIAAGHYSMAIPTTTGVVLGLPLIAAGTGLIKPSMGSMVSHLYRGETGKRDAAWSVFYMSIQVSALLAPVVTGLLGERINWHLGFGAAAVGMTVGLVQYVLGSRHFGDLGAAPTDPAPPELRRRVARWVTVAVVVAALLVAVDVAAGTFTIEHVLAVIGVAALVVPVLTYRAILRSPTLDAADRRRLRAFRWLLLASAVFWLPYDQGGSLLNLFAERQTDRDVLGFEFPASWLQSLHPGFILLLAPLFAWLWVRTDRRIGVPAKFAAGLALMCASFLVMAVAAQRAADGVLVTVWWLVLVYLLQVCGELALAPTGLSALSQVAPPALVGQLMGVWWLFAALGVAIGGQVARLADVVPQTGYFAGLGLLVALVATMVALGARRLGRHLA
ncbi:hypothetical protein AWW66_01235 [Micromonospora rosaria]|uniref:Amino acid transporter n=1 Tax=Micromonospora rosaria TaxID=47874 RepID=A0A136PZJ5_9ACTN|nr:oligopeptide:H+ symporter [Micromonospora rosaria]KXK63875.1 hypothetical protein AWW66_01235 [Micromonospora rosaria]